MSSNPIPLQDQINQLCNRHSAVLYTMVVNQFEGIAGFTIHQDVIMRKTMRQPFPNINPPTPDGWPDNYTRGVSGLLSYNNASLGLVITSPTNVTLSWPTVTLSTHRPVSRLLQNRKASRYGDQPYSMYRIDYAERGWMEANRVPTQEEICRMLGLQFWNTQKNLTVEWVLMENLAAVVKRIQAKDREYVRLQREPKDQTVVRTEVYDAYIKDVWTPRQVWYAATKAKK